MFGFGNMFGETYEVTLEVYIGNQLAQKQTMEAPKEIIMMNFMQLVQQIRNDTRPMKIRITRPEIIWDNFEKEYKTLTNEVECKNAKMIAFEEGECT